MRITLSFLLLLIIQSNLYATDFAVGVTGGLRMVTQRESLLNDAIPHVKFNNETGISYQLGELFAFLQKALFVFILV